MKEIWEPVGGALVIAGFLAAGVVVLVILSVYTVISATIMLLCRTIERRLVSKAYVEIPPACRYGPRRMTALKP